MSKSLGDEFSKRMKERGGADESRWAREQDQEALRKLREKLAEKKEGGEDKPKGPAPK